jgi:membrane protein
MVHRLSLLWRRLILLFHKEIWQPAYLRDTSAKGRTFAVLRIISITLTGLAESRATSRAAALSFSTLLGLAPLIGIAVLVAGFAVGNNNTDLVTDKLNELIRFIAPQLVHYDQTPNDPAPPPAAQEPSGPTEPGKADRKIAVNPQLVTLINDAIAGTRSAAGGVVSTISLILIVLLLFTSVEQVFNDIWGVRRGRSWLVRIVSYWTILTLGAVLFFGAVGAVSVTTFISFFEQELKDKLPFGTELARALTFSMPALSVLLLVTILSLFYRFIPNTHVSWRAAFTGAVVVSLLLVMNNLLAFTYFSRVDMQKSLYGSLALLPVLMVGLYIFWLFVLVGGQISYAVQNVHFRNSQAAWSNLSEFTRERLTLVVLLTIARRFQACLPPCTVSELGSTIRVPTQVLNECLNRLVDLGFVSPIPPDPRKGSSDYLYQPARPLNRITLQHFKHSFENFGHDPASEGIGRLDPIVQSYESALNGVSEQELFTTPLDQLFTRYSFDLPARRPESAPAAR